MSGTAMFFIIVGAATLTSKFFKVIDLIERG